MVWTVLITAAVEPVSAVIFPYLQTTGTVVLETLPQLFGSGEGIRRIIKVPIIIIPRALCLLVSLIFHS